MTLETEAEARRRIRNYTVEEAVNFVLTPGSDSELSELSDDDELDTVDEVTQIANEPAMPVDPPV